MESPRTVGGRGMTFGKIYKQDGTLVISCAQEGLIRTEKVEEMAKL
jgi:acyl-CoA thioesterase